MPSVSSKRDTRKAAGREFTQVSGLQSFRGEGIAYRRQRTQNGPGMCPADPAHPHRQRVLVVEPEPIVHEFITTALYRAGYGVIAARDGLQAGHLFHRHSLELAVLIVEISLPQLSGPEFVSCLPTLTPRIPVLFTSCEGEPYRQNRAMPVLLKPFRAADLYRELRGQGLSIPWQFAEKC
jgi:CheY-like chemotaxis protein